MGCRRVSVHLLRMLRMSNSRTQTRLIFIFILFYRIERVSFLSWYFYVARDRQKKTLFAYCLYVWGECMVICICALLSCCFILHTFDDDEIFEMENSLEIVGNGIWVDSLSLFIFTILRPAPCNAQRVYNIYNGTYFNLKGMPNIQLRSASRIMPPVYFFLHSTGAEAFFFSIPKESVKSMTHLNPFHFVMAKVILSQAMRLALAYMCITSVRTWKESSFYVLNERYGSTLCGVVYWMLLHIWWDTYIRSRGLHDKTIKTEFICVVKL